MVETSARGAIIFASGMEEKTISRHFSPDEKGTLLEYVLDSVWTVADEIQVVFANEPKLSIVEEISSFGAKVVTTPRGVNGSMAIFSAFRSSRAEHCLLVTERAPLLKPNVALFLYDSAHGYDLAIPRWNSGKVEPLLAVYRNKTLLRLVGATGGLMAGDISAEMTSIIDQIFDVKYVSIEDELGELDPELDSFLEVSDDATLSSAQAKASIKGRATKAS
ncbi:MAG: NTP transferase domain-containing protein [Nitrososphaerales archaeon]